MCVISGYLCVWLCRNAEYDSCRTSAGKIELQVTIRVEAYDVGGGTQQVEEEEFFCQAFLCEIVESIFREGRTGRGGLVGRRWWGEEVVLVGGGGGGLQEGCWDRN